MSHISSGSGVPPRGVFGVFPGAGGGGPCGGRHAAGAAAAQLRGSAGAAPRGATRGADGGGARPGGVGLVKSLSPERDSDDIVEKIE